MGFSALGLRVARLGLLRVGEFSRWADELCALCGACRADPLGESGSRAGRGVGRADPLGESGSRAGRGVGRADPLGESGSRAG